MESLQR